MGFDFLAILSGLLGLFLPYPHISRYFKALRSFKLLFLIK
jgi:hypothetical protein